MKFINEEINTEKYVDSVFGVNAKAKQDPEALLATTGCLYTEQGRILTYRTVFDSESTILSREKASYAQGSSGNKEYRDAITKYILEDKVSLPKECIATAGGTGALYLAFRMCVDKNTTILYPEISWGNYKTMFNESGYKNIPYDVYDLDDLLNKIDLIQGKIAVIINSPCENPCGHEYTYDQFKTIIDKLNSLNREAVLINDLAYLDYAGKESKKFFELYNTINDNVLILLAISTSKSFSYYGQRLGALITIYKDEEYVKAFDNTAGRILRTVWSNVNNGAMINVAKVINNNLENFKKEVEESRIMLKKRADLFISQAKKCGLETYEYTSGFFITVKFDDNKHRDEVHERLMNNHIYTVKVNKGIRVAICSVPLNKLDGLAKRIKEVM